MARRSPGALGKLCLGLWMMGADCYLTYMGGPPKGRNGRFPKEESRGRRGAKRVLRDVKGELGLGACGRLPSSLMTSLRGGGLLSGGGC